MNECPTNEPPTVNSEEIVRMVDAGLTYLEISKKTGISRSTVCRIYGKQTGKRLRKKPVDLNEVLYLESMGMTVTEIAVRLGYPRKTIYSVLSRINEGGTSQSSPSSDDLEPDKSIARLFRRREDHDQGMRASA